MPPSAGSAMLAKCGQLLAAARQQETALVALWERRLQATEQFTEVL
jgi:hypothetical protein